MILIFIVGIADALVAANAAPSRVEAALLNQDVAAGDFEAAYIESFRCRLRRGWRLIASQLPHQRKDDVSIGAVVVLL